MKKNHLPIQIISVLFLFATISPTFAKDESNLFLRTDRRIFNSIYDEPPQIRSVMEAITDLGDGEAMLGLLLLLVAFGDEQKFEAGKLMTSAFIGTSATIFALKQATRRKRPLEEKVGLSSSFPSGHSGNAFVIATILGYEYPRLRIPLYVGATLVAFSRIYLGRHYPSDVLVGATLGTLISVGVMQHKEFILKLEF